MSRSKRLFIALAVLFFIGLGYIAYDISSRTTFPGSKPLLKEESKSQSITPDSVSQDTLKATQR